MRIKEYYYEQMFSNYKSLEEEYEDFKRKEDGKLSEYINEDGILKDEEWIIWL